MVDLSERENGLWGRERRDRANSELDREAFPPFSRFQCCCHPKFKRAKNHLFQISEVIKFELQPWVRKTYSPAVTFHGLQYALFITCFVEILGAVVFIVTSLFIIDDKERAENEGLSQRM